MRRWILSSGSSACTGNGSSRTCTTTVTVPTGSDVFTVTIYNQAPVNNTIPAGAAILGVGSSTVDVVAGSTTSVPVFVGGEIAHLGATIPSGSLPANGQPQSAVLVIAPTDFGDNPITAGANDPYANPITVAVTESGGSGYASLSLNGGAASSSVLVTKSTDSVTLNYTGGGVPGYSFTITLSASGVASQSSTIAPLIASVNGTTVASVSLNGSAVGAVQLGLGEAGSSRTYTASLTSCTNIATIGALSGSGGSATLPVTGGSAPSASGCTLTITDSGSVALVLPVTNTPVTHSVTINGTQITEFGGWSGPYGMAVGPDGNIWLTDVGTDTVNSFNPSNGAGVFNLFISGSSLVDIVAGADGAMWATDANLEGVDRVTTTNTLTQYPLPSGGTPHGITSDSSGQLWVASAGPNSIWTLSAGGAFNPISITPSGQPSSIAVGPDGAIWFTEQTWIGRYNPADASFTETVVPNSGGAQYITAGPDSAMWFTGSSAGGGFVARIPMHDDGPFTPTAYATTGTSPMGIAAGADNAMWFVDNVANTVSEISLTSHAITNFTLPTSNAAPQEIVRGPDGSLWLTEYGANQVAHVIP